MGAIEKIRAQQARLEEGGPAWTVGEQLAEICAAEPESERLVDTDLNNPDMGLADCERKIKAWADSHKKGDFSFVSPMKAEEIIREFYGLPGRKQADPARPDKPAPKAGGTINLLDFM